MIGDKLSYHTEYRDINRWVINKLNDELHGKDRICISVGGESGCGKTSLAYALLKDIEESTGLKGFLFHLDDYFKLPPHDNHNRRLKDMNQVGVHEVDLELLDSNLKQFRNGEHIIKPLVDYHNNKILNEEVVSSNFNFCIVEGTYVSELDLPNYKIFIETTYLDTRKLRVSRGRDQISDFNERVLEIEHRIIRDHGRLAHLIIDKELNTKTNK